MKVLAISSGSKNGSNDAMAKEALMGAKEHGAEVEFIRLLDLDLKPCTGCIACVAGMMQGGHGNCIIKDDFNWLDAKVQEADGLIWTTPIFEKGAPGVLHVVQDRLCGPGHDPGINAVAREIAGKMGKPGPDPKKTAPKATSFISIGGSDWFTRISAVMNTMAMATMWKVIDDQVFSWSKSIILDDAAVAKCRQVGVNMVKAVTDLANAKYNGDQGVCPHCHCRNFFLHGDGTAECEVCGIRGQLKIENNRFVFCFADDQLSHAHNTMSGKKIHMDDIYRNETKLAADRKSQEFRTRQDKYKEFISSTRPH